MKIIKREPLGLQPVYDIGVSSSRNINNFLLENGIIASNCFNKAHSVSYSFLTYISAYLKTHYPVEFFTALMSTRSKTLQPKSWALKAPEYIAEAKKFNVEVYPPNVNNSGYEFTIHNSQIFFGLNAIRDVGKTAAKSIMSSRRSTPFKDIKDFISRVNLQKVNTKTFEALVKAGAFDSMGYLRSELLEKTSELYSYHKNLEEYNQRLIDILARENQNRKIIPLIERRNFLRKEVKKITNKIDKNKASQEQLDIYPYHLEELEKLEDQKLKKLASLKEKPQPEFPTFSRYKQVEITLPYVLAQAHYIGCYIGGHPITMLDIPRKNLCDIDEYTKKAKIAGIVLSYKPITTRKGKKMAFLEVDDSTGSAEIILFPSLFQKYNSLDITEGDILIIEANVDKIEPLKLIPNKINKYRIENALDT